MTGTALTGETAEFASSVLERRLPNGLTVLLIPREGVATAHFAMAFGAGAVDEPDGRTGIAHLYEHMAFKGTDSVGTRNRTRERPILRQLDELDAEILAERGRGARADRAKIAGLKARFERLEAKAEALVEPNEFDSVYARNGGRGLNAFTSQDATCYILALPSNRVPLWCAMEGARVRNPVLRQFYRERNVVIEELRIYRDNPHWRLWDELGALALTAHPYRVPVVGWLSDLEAMRPADLESFFRSHYRPERAVIAVAGAVTKATFKVIEREFGSWRASAPAARPVVTVEPEQKGERRAVVHMQANPAVACAWPVPTWGHPDKPALDALASILANGDSSRLHVELVKKLQIAVSVSASAGFPGERYPNLLCIAAWPRAPHTPEACEAAIADVIGRVVSDGVAPRELEKTTNLLSSQILQQLQDNTWMAAELASAHAALGDWRTRLRWIEDLRRLSPGDIGRVARDYLVAERRNVVTIEESAAAAGRPAQAAPAPGPVLPEHPDA